MRITLSLDSWPALRDFAGSERSELAAAASLAELAGVDALRLSINEDLAPVRETDVETLRLALLDYCRLEDRRTHQAQRVAEIERVLQAIASYDASFRSEFGREHDHVALVGQDNIRRYLPVGSVRVRVHAEDSLFDLFARVCAARTAGCRVTVSTPPNLPSADVELLDELTDPWGASIEFLRESDAELAAVIAAGQTERVRYAAWDRAPREVLRSVGASGIFVARTPVLAEGRVELLWYLREQSISHNYHRYGNLGERSDEKRRPVL